MIRSIARGTDSVPEFYNRIYKAGWPQGVRFVQWFDTDSCVEFTNVVDEGYGFCRFENYSDWVFKMWGQQ